MQKKPLNLLALLLCNLASGGHLDQINGSFVPKSCCCNHYDCTVLVPGLLFTIWGIWKILRTVRHLYTVMLSNQVPLKVSEGYSGMPRQLSFTYAWGIIWLDWALLPGEPSEIDSACCVSVFGESGARQKEPELVSPSLRSESTRSSSQ